MNNEEEIIQLLSKYLDGNITEEECKWVEDFLLQEGKSSGNYPSKKNVQISIELWTSLVEKLKLSHQDKNNGISNIKIATEEDLIHFIREAQKQRRLKIPKKSNTRRIIKYASVAASIIGIIFIGVKALRLHNEYNSQNRTELFSDNSVKCITLSDSSVVYLNKGTSLSVNNALFNKNNREIWMNGEAYFEVAKNPDKPFIVHSGDFNVEVKGTAFNIKSYSEINRYVVSVSHGKVEVDKGKSQLGILTKNNELAFDMNQNNYQIVKKNTALNHEWIRGKLLFDNVNIQELKLRLKQRYNVDLELKLPISYFNDILFSSPALSSDAGAYDIMERFCTIYNLNFAFSADHTKCVLSQ